MKSSSRAPTNVFRRGLAVVLVLIFLFSAGTLCWLTILSPQQSQHGFDAYKDLLISSTASAPSSSAENHDTSPDEPDASPQILPKFALLAAQNPYFAGWLTDENDFRRHLYQFRIRSMFRIPDDGGPDDNYLVLSTCSYLYWGDRLVILARRLRDGECADIDTAAYEKNPLQLWPDKYYTLDYVHASRPTDTDIRAGHDAYYFR